MSRRRRWSCTNSRSHAATIISQSAVHPATSWPTVFGRTSYGWPGYFPTLSIRRWACVTHGLDVLRGSPLMRQVSVGIPSGNAHPEGQADRTLQAHRFSAADLRRACRGDRAGNNQRLEPSTRNLDEPGHHAEGSRISLDLEIDCTIEDLCVSLVIQPWNIFDGHGPNP